MSMRRMTITAADQMSVGALPDAAAERRIVLTRWGQDVAVFDTAELWNETARSVKSVTEELARHYTGLTTADTDHRSVADLCSRLGLDVDAVRERAHQLRRRFEDG